MNSQSERLISDKDIQKENAFDSIVQLERFIDCKELHFWKAPLPIDTLESDISVRLLHRQKAFVSIVLQTGAYIEDKEEQWAKA